MFEIAKSINISASRECVYSALTSSEEIPKYFPLKEVESIWQIGSEVLYKGEVNGASFTDFGVIEELVSPSIYTYRYWSDNHGTERLPENHITISYLLSENVESTKLVVFQSNIKSRELYELMDKQVWDSLLGSLKEYAETRI
jgi:uncharacterized protein YndB with AHSA1/START domain